MKSIQKKMVAAYVKEARLAKGYTQKEVSEMSNISVRSIQRIESGDIVPRSYTLKALSEILGTSFETIQQAEPLQKKVVKTNYTQKIVLSIGIPLFIVLACWAFIAQSPGFPETLFELLTIAAIVLIIIVATLIFIWRTKA
ncbi:MAG: helix-turn-helix transcriptional regulator [Chitinophagaceae bacterium]